MTDKELLLEISNMMDRKISPIKEDISNIKRDIIDMKKGMLDMKKDILNMKEDISNMQEDIVKMKEDISEIREDMSGMEMRITNLEVEVKDIKAKVSHIELVVESDVKPRLQNIESCYLATYQRYIEETKDMQVIKMDVEVLKSVVAEHSKKLQKLETAV